MRLFRKEHRKNWILLLAATVTAIVAYFFLPEVIPIHWNGAGQIDGYGGRSWIFLFPGIILAMIFLSEFCRKTDPRSANYTSFGKIYYLLFFALDLFILVVEISVIAASAGIDFGMNRIITLTIGILFMVIGCAMPKIKVNYFVGIRCAWTLASEDVWTRTHRLGGRMWFIGGLVMIPAAFLPGVYSMVFMFADIAVLVIVPLVYSCVIYKRLEREGKLHKDAD